MTALAPIIVLLVMLLSPDERPVDARAFLMPDLATCEAKNTELKSHMAITAPSAIVVGICLSMAKSTNEAPDADPTLAPPPPADPAPGGEHPDDGTI